MSDKSYLTKVFYKCDDSKIVMKNYPQVYLTIGVLLFAFAPSLGFAQFRECEFGMKPEEIVRVEKAPFINSNPLALVFQDQLFGFDTFVGYHLSQEDDTFVMGSYTINVTGTEIEEILDHYMDVVDALDNRYGRSLKPDTVWWRQDSKYREDLVNAFRFGDVSFRKEWYGAGVNVALNLSNEMNRSGEIVYRITYVPGRKYNATADVAKL